MSLNKTNLGNPSNSGRYNYLWSNNSSSGNPGRQRTHTLHPLDISSLSRWTDDGQHRLRGEVTPEVCNKIELEPVTPELEPVTSSLVIQSRKTLCTSSLQESVIWQAGGWTHHRAPWACTHSTQDMSTPTIHFPSTITVPHLVDQATLQGSALGFSRHLPLRERKCLPSPSGWLIVPSSLQSSGPIPVIPPPSGPKPDATAPSIASTLTYGENSLLS